MPARVPPYFDFLIEGFHRGLVSRFVHLGHWDHAPHLDASVPPRPGEFELAQERLNAILLDRADLHDGQRVLDVGCGFGGTLQEVNQRCGHMWLVGVNIDLRQLAICRQLEPLHNNVCQWVEADACHLPFAAGSFDRVLCIEAMFHFRSRRTFFREATRVLRPGGILVLSDIVLGESAQYVDVPGFCIEAAVCDGYGPWPDFWGEDADHGTLGQAVGLYCTWRLDATASTRPSHGFTVPGFTDTRRDPGDAALRAAMMLRWLHDNGHLQYLYIRFDKPPSNTGNRVSFGR